MGYYMPPGDFGRMPADVMKSHILPHPTPPHRRRQIGALWEAAVNGGLDVFLHV